MAARRERGLLDPDAAPARALRPHDLVHRLRRRPRGGHQQRGVVAGRHPAARQPRAALGRQPHLHRGRHRRSPSPRTSSPATRRTAGTSSASTGCATTAIRRERRRRSTRRPRGRGGDRPAVVHRAAHDHRLAGARRRRTPARRTAPRSATTRSPRPRRSSASTRSRTSRSPTTCSRTPARSSSAAGPPTPSGRSVPRLARGQPRARRAARPAGAAPSCPTAGRMRCPTFEPTDKGMATRKASGEVLNAHRARCCPSCGAARPTWPSRTTPRPEGEPSFLPTDRQSKEFPGGPYGRVLHFGIREHAMGAIMNGIALHGGTRPTAARSSCSATTCAPPCGWRR